MPRTDFYNWNKNRSYPLQPQESYTFQGVELPEDVLYDAGFILGVDEPYDEQHRIKLQAIRRYANNVYFYFKSASATGEFILTCDIADPPGTAHYTDSTIGETEGGVAFVVTGDLNELWTAIGSDIILAADGAYYAEPATAQYLNNSFVKALNVATEKDDPGTEMCAEEPTERWDFALTGRALTGVQLFRPGYNAYVNTDVLRNYIEIGAVIGRGEGEPCGRIELEDRFAGHTDIIPAGTLYECVEGISTINGVGPTDDGVLTINATSGIEVESVPAENKIIIKFLSGFDSPFCVGDPE